MRRSLLAARSAATWLGDGGYSARFLVGQCMGQRLTL